MKSNRLIGIARFVERPEAAIVLLVLLWACGSLVNLSVRSFIWEEGTNASIARQILSGEEFFPPVIYGLRQVDKPYLLAWLIAGISVISGHVTEWSARLPSMLAVLATTLLVCSVARRYASMQGAFFAGVSFLFCPMLLQKLSIAEPDTFVTLLSFSTLVLWWNGVELNRITISRWIGCGSLLAIMTLFKGPQPVAFFALAVFAYVVINRRYYDLFGLSICLALPTLTAVVWVILVYQPGDEQLWLSIHRMHPQPLFDYFANNLRSILSVLLQLIPAVLLAPFASSPSRWFSRHRPDHGITIVLVYYSILSTAVLFLWPGGFVARYAMPIAPAIAVLGGLAWDKIATRNFFPLKILAGSILLALGVYQLVLVTIVMPLYSERFGASRIDGSNIARAIRTASGPVFCADFATNQLFYVRIVQPIKCLSEHELANAKISGWLLIPEYWLPEFRRLRPDLSLREIVKTTSGSHITAVRVISN